MYKLSVPFKGVPFESSLSSFGFNLYLLVLGVVLGGAGAHGLARPSNQNQPPRHDIDDCINSEWLRRVLPVPIVDDEDEQLEHYKPNNISTHRMYVFGLRARPRASDIFSPFALVSPLTAVPSTGTVECIREELS
jgi:hypothetical protein